MSKDELLPDLRTAVQAERAAALATRNIVSTFAWSGLDLRARDEVADTLEAIAVGHDKRVAELSRLVADIERGIDDVF
jgi:hypothetical protein